MKFTQQSKIVSKISFTTPLSWVDVTHAGASSYSNSGACPIEFWLGDAVTPPADADIGFGGTVNEANEILTPDAEQKIWILSSQFHTLRLTPYTEV